MLKNTSIEGVVKDVIVSKELHNELSERSDKEVQEFYDLNNEKYTSWHKFLSIREDLKINVLTSEKVLKKRGLLKNYYLTFGEETDTFEGAVYDTEKNVKESCEILNKGNKEKIIYETITKKEYEKIRDKKY